MTDKIVKVGLWESAPFGGSILSGIEKLNLFLKSENLDVRYEPVRLDANNLPAQEDTPDVLILDGGEDVNPARYGQKDIASSFNDNRDRAEFALVGHFEMFGKRLSGICRGHQLLNVHYGGGLIQDINSSGMFSKSALDYHKGGHKVRLKRPTRKGYRTYGGFKKKNKKRGHIISRFVGVNPFTVSSMHHQCIKDLGNNLGVSLSFGGGKRGNFYIVEGIESSDGKIRGLQSHPEFSGYPKDGLMFSYLMHVDNFVDNLFEPDMEEVRARLEEGQVEKKPTLPFDMQNRPQEPTRRRLRTRDDRAREEQEIFGGPDEVIGGNVVITNPQTFTIGGTATAGWEPNNGTDNR